MAESVTLTTPITKPSQTTVSIDRIHLDVPDKAVHIQWISNTGEAGSAYYPTPPPASNPTQPSGAILLHQLNIGNFSAVSLVKRALQQLLSDGYITAGTISGAPD